MQTQDPHRSKLPQQLQNPSLRFVKLLPKSKKPYEKDWTRKPYKSDEIECWFSEGNNYGILGGHGGLIIVDADTPEIVSLLDKLPPTARQKTPKKGKHALFFCPEIKGKIILAKDGKHYGEIITSGGQVVGPGSIHPETGTAYVWENNLPIAEVTKDEIFKVFDAYTSSRQKCASTKTLLEQENKKIFKQLVFKYGQPFYFNDKKKVSGINENFWAGLHDRENLEVFEPLEENFYSYDEATGLYNLKTPDVIKKEISARILRVGHETGLPGIDRLRTSARLNGVVALLRGLCEKTGAFDKQQNFIHVGNGVIVFGSNHEAQLRKFSPEFLSRNQSPISFDEKATCHRFLQELLLPSVTRDDAVLIQKYVGLCLLGKNLIQRFMILDGLPARGKSTLSTIIQNLIGMRNVTQLRTKHLSERFELSRFLKKTLLVGVDVPSNFLSERGTHVLKGLVGGDVLSAEVKNVTGSFQIVGHFCVLITSNTKLSLEFDGDAGAWKRRLLLVPFEGPLPKKKIPNFAERLIKEEGPGILNWALVGLAMVLADVERYGDIDLTRSQKAHIQGLLSISDSLCAFLEECIVRKDGAELPISQLVLSYEEFCFQNGWSSKPETIVRNELGSLMLDLFGVTKAHSIKVNGKEVRGFRNVAIKDAGVNNAA